MTKKQPPLKDSNINLRDITIDLELYPGYQVPNGALCPQRACHGLFFYYLRASLTRERELEGYVLEGEEDPKFNYDQLFTTVCRLYGVTPEEMNNHWRCVDGQAWMLGLPKLKDPVVRRDKVIEIS